MRWRLKRHQMICPCEALRYFSEGAEPGANVASASNTSSET
jgi:hypothetical protein